MENTVLFTDGSRQFEAPAAATAQRLASIQAERERIAGFERKHGISLQQAFEMNARQFGDELTTEEAEAGMATLTWSHDIQLSNRSQL